MHNALAVHNNKQEKNLQQFSWKETFVNIHKYQKSHKNMSVFFVMVQSNKLRKLMQY